MTDLTALAERLAPCPFCGAAPHHGLEKVRYCQLHGDRMQDYSIWCPHQCARIVQDDRKAAIAAWNRRTPDPSALREARDAGLEAAAAWHDGEEDRLRALAALYEKTCFFQKAEMERLRASFHETSAAVIRALKGKEG